MARTRTTLVWISVLLFMLLIISVVLLQNEAYFLLNIIFIGAMLVPFFIRFEKKIITTREIVMLAVCAAIAAISRVPFAAIPGVQPASFMIIITGFVFGAESGFIVGAIAALGSNIFLGQGPWTPWQMYAWGMMGMTAGLLRHTWMMKKQWARLLFGFFWGFLFGWIMNLWIILSHIENMTWQFVLGLNVASFYHDLFHALANVFFLAMFSSSFIKIMERFKKKYDLLNEK